jgi:multimeric flavodoxin WrbA
MKVLLVNGSSHLHGTTMQAISEIVKVLEEQGVETEIIQTGSKPIADCLGCGGCRREGECILKDEVNEFVKKAKEADGFVFATPVYYAHPSGRILSFLDRAFFSASADVFAHKPAAAVACARRAGTSSSLDVLQKYFNIAGMPMVGSTYWGNVFGANANDAMQDLEGMQTMRNLAMEMVWMMRCFQLGKENGIEPPAFEKGAHTNFIR